MDSGIQKSILQMARGAIQERADYEMSSLLNNILDPNTSATAARKLTITLTLKPDDTRQNITVSCVATSKLAATNPVTTALYVADEDTIVEMVPQIPGQMAVDGTEQDAPPTAMSALLTYTRTRWQASTCTIRPRPKEERVCVLSA